MAKGNASGCDVSVVVCASREGRLLHRTLATVAEAMVRAGLAGFSSELIVSLHDADEETATFARDRGGVRARILEGGNDRIEARNIAAHRAHGTHVAWIDAGDICGATWLERSAEAAERDGRGDVVWHPQHCLTLMGDSFRLREYADQELAPREPAAFFWAPPYPYAAFAETALHRRIPFRAHEVVRGYLRGEWHWTNETLALGILHKVVTETYVGLQPDAAPNRLNFGPAPQDMRPAPLPRSAKAAAARTEPGGAPAAEPDAVPDAVLGAAPAAAAPKRKRAASS